MWRKHVGDGKKQIIAQSARRVEAMPLQLH